jgi:hypothetical protein
MPRPQQSRESVVTLSPPRFHRLVLADWPTFELATVSTLLLLLLYAGTVWYTRIPIRAMALAALFLPRLRHNILFWCVVFGTLLHGAIVNWHATDNHQFLIAYWCLAVAVSLVVADRDGTLRLNARLLIGLSFSFAVAWKLISPDFTSTSFFSFTLLEPRFAHVAQTVGAISPHEWKANRHAMAELLRYDSDLNTVALHSTPRIQELAALMTIWALLTEILVAVSFLAPERSAIGRWRDLFLLIFMLSLYWIAPVIGFAWILAVMGAVQFSTSLLYGRALYVMCLIVLQFALIPWHRLLG